MEKLLTQVRDNLRLSNWTCFPGNSIEFVIISDTQQEKVFKRGGEPCFAVRFTKDEWGNLYKEEYIDKNNKDGRDNI